MKDYYEILQVSTTSEPEVITAAYKRLARKYHPDVYAGRDATERMRELNEAYEVLSDPHRRTEYDRVHGGSYGTAAHNTPDASGERDRGQEAAASGSVEHTGQPSPKRRLRLVAGVLAISLTALGIGLALGIPVMNGDSDGNASVSSITPSPGNHVGGTTTPTVGGFPSASDIAAGELQARGKEIGPESVWDALQNETALMHLHECDMISRFECVKAIMEEGRAFPQAIEFFNMTGFFLSKFQETGRVDLGLLCDPWRANDNCEYAFVNSIPFVIYLAEEVRPVAIELDPAYKGLDAAFPKGDRPVGLLLWPTHQIFEAIGASPQGGQRFIFQFEVVNGCHACGTGYFARVAFDFAPDGTYLGADPRPLGLCKGSGPDVTPVVPSIAACPSS